MRFLCLVSILIIFIIIATAACGDSSSTGTRVVVAAQDIPAGTTLSTEVLILDEVPVAVAGAFDDTQPLIGKVTRIQIAAGEQLSSTKIGPLRDDAVPLGWPIPTQ